MQHTMHASDTDLPQTDLPQADLSQAALPQAALPQAEGDVPPPARRSQRRSNAIINIALILTLVVGSFVVGNTVKLGANPVFAQTEEPSQFAVFWEAWGYVQNHFVDQNKIDPVQMTYGAIEGMLNTLGDQGHTTFMTADEVIRHAEDLENSFEGIGAYVTTEENQIKIVTPIHNSPAEAAGILAGDLIVAVNGQETFGMTLNDVIDQIRGPAGSTVILTVLHPDSTDTVEIEIERAEIQEESVSWSLIPDTRIAYVEITQFADRTGSELASALWEVRRTRIKGDPVEGVILDLRNNPGGYLREAIRVGSQFLDEGLTILQEEDAQARRIVHESRGRGWGRDLPLVVLINPGTASAAEITAGALQENNRATLIGEVTFGTGTVLNQFSLSDGSAILLGVANWLTPSGRLIKGQGIVPDQEVIQQSSVLMLDSYSIEEMSGAELLATEDIQFLAALETLQEKIDPTIRAGTPDNSMGSDTSHLPSLTAPPTDEDLAPDPQQTRSFVLLGRG